MQTHPHLNMHTLTPIHTYMQTHSHTYAGTSTHTHTYAHMQAHPHTPTHAHIHAHTQIHTQEGDKRYRDKKNRGAERNFDSQDLYNVGELEDYSSNRFTKPLQTIG